MFLYTITINCVTTGARKKPTEYMFCFIYSQQCIIIISLRKMCGFICSVLKKIIPNNTTPTFQEVGGVTQPDIFCRWQIALLSKRLWYCCSGIYLLETSNSVINCIITVPDCGLPNGTKLTNFMN